MSAPEYILLISDLAGEQRFASIVAKRLESLVSFGEHSSAKVRLLSPNYATHQSLSIMSMRSLISITIFFRGR